MRALLGRVSGEVHRLAMAVACLALLVMLASMALQVIARYVFQVPPAWTEELCRFCMVWAGMLGATTAFHERSDPTIITIRADASRTERKLAYVVRVASTLIFIVPVLFYCFTNSSYSFAGGYLGRNLNKASDTLGITMVWVAAAVPLAFLIILLHILAGRSGAGEANSELLT